MYSNVYTEDIVVYSTCVHRGHSRVQYMCTQRTYSCTVHVYTEDIFVYSTCVHRGTYSCTVHVYTEDIFVYSTCVHRGHIRVQYIA